MLLDYTIYENLHLEPKDTKCKHTVISKQTKNLNTLHIVFLNV